MSVLDWVHPELLLILVASQKCGAATLGTNSTYLRQDTSQVIYTRWEHCPSNRNRRNKSESYAYAVSLRIKTSVHCKRPGDGLLPNAR